MTTIQDCAGSVAAERRERRRQKILANANDRLSAILSGPDGNENRLAPTMEDMDTHTSTEEVCPFAKESTSSLDTSARSKLIADELEINYVEPVYFESINRNRFFIALFLGLVFHIVVHFAWTDRVALTFATILFAYEMLALPQKSLKYPKHGYLVNFLLVGGLNERLVVYVGIFIDLLWDFLVDLTIVAFSYLSVQLLVNAFQKTMQLL
uniref:Uncharacterized protein n=1 Tax=Ditylenchus dipsaci TaxID=166011 RepID=A0A915DV22_9BILA